MGAKIWILVASSSSPAERLERSPSPDREAATALARRLFPSRALVPLHDADLSQTCPRGGEIQVGCFGDLSIVSSEDFAIDRPSSLPPAFLEAFPGQRVDLVCMHSVVDWCAFARWDDGRLVRSLSLSSDGLVEDIGPPLPFELRLRESATADGAETESDIHPLERGDAALLDLLGFQIDGGEERVDPTAIRLLRFGRPKPWWKFW